jgi:tetratricopeptide (TPR) repeat protein
MTSNASMIHRSLIVAILAGWCASMAEPVHAQSVTELQAEKSLVWKMLHRGDFARARAILEPLTTTARDSRENGLGAKSSFYLECLSLLGAIELRMGLLPEAAAHLTEAKDGYTRKRKAFKDDYRQAVARGQVGAFAAYAGSTTAFFCRDLDWLGEVMLEQKSYPEAEALFDESLQAREAAIADGLLPNEPVPSGLMMSKHLKGLLELRQGEFERARHYLEEAREEFDAFLEAGTPAENTDADQDQADTAQSEPDSEAKPAPTDDVEQLITMLDRTLTHVSLLTHLGEVELAEGNVGDAAAFARQAIETGTAALGPKHGVVLEPTVLFVKANASLADRRLKENDPRGARTALQAAMLAYSSVETLVEKFWAPAAARRTEARELISAVQSKLSATEAAVAALDEAEKAADVAMKKAEDEPSPAKTVVKRRVIRRVVPKKTEEPEGSDGQEPKQAAQPAAAEPAAAN